MNDKTYQTELKKSYPKGKELGFVTLEEKEGKELGLYTAI